MVMEGEAERHAGKPYSLEPERVEERWVLERGGSSWGNCVKNMEVLGGGSKECPLPP